MPAARESGGVRPPAAPPPFAVLRLRGVRIIRPSLKARSRRSRRPARPSSGSSGGSSISGLRAAFVSNAASPSVSSSDVLSGAGRRKSLPGTAEKSRERSSPVVPTFEAPSQGFQQLGGAPPPQLVKSGYRRYPALKSVHALRDELADAGIKSKCRMRPDGTAYGGQTLSRGALYMILQNRLYRGEISHKGHSFPGEHLAIVDKPLWDEVQAVLAANRVERATGARGKHPSLLTGMVFDETGERLTPTYAVKKGTRYRYYVSTSLFTGAGRNRSSGRRIPAGNLEGLVINRLRTFLADPGAI